MWTDVLEAGEGPLECVGGTAMSQYFCEVCDKDLKTEENMKQHFKEHIPCAFPGCKFNAHFLVIEKHIRMAHGNGIGVISLETEEDIRKWREERRKNFPTKRKIEEKKNNEKARLLRGENIKSKKFDSKEKRAENRIKKQKEKNKKKEFKKGANTKEKRSKGLVNYDSSSSSSSEEISESESEEESEPAAKELKFTNPRLQKVSENIKAQPEYETLYNNKLLRSHNTNILKNGKKVRYPVGSYKNKFTGEREMPNLARPTLLEMLLKDEIRNERNQILQALHFIVKENFFDKED